MAYCKKCNRAYKDDENDKNHTCDIVIIKRKDDEEGTSKKTVHASRVAEDGDLHKDVTGDGEWEIIFRQIHKLEKLFEDEKNRKDKKND